LQPVFLAVDRYVQSLGDMFAVLDREFAFTEEAPPSEKPVADRIATLGRSMLYLNLEDAKLASLASVRFGAEVERRADPWDGVSPHRDNQLAARLILLVDYVRKQRLEYKIAGGVAR
jgi:hypothetical protein